MSNSFDAVSGVEWVPVRCNLCGNDVPRKLLVDTVHRAGQAYDFSIVRCGHCGLIYTHPRGRGQIFGNLQGGGARSDARVANLPIYTSGIRLIRQALHQEKLQPGQGLRCLDIGCAYGDFLAFGREQGWSMEGVEIVPGLAAHAGARGFKVHNGELPELGLPPASFDVLTMWDVIEHLEDPLAYLRAGRTLLKAGGLLFLHTGNALFQVPKARLLGLLFPGRGPYLIPYQHLFHFTPRTARGILEAAGFEPVAAVFCGTLRYKNRWKRALLGGYNRFAQTLAAAGVRLLTSSMGILGRRPER